MKKIVLIFMVLLGALVFGQENNTTLPSASSVEKAAKYPGGLNAIRRDIATNFDMTSLTSGFYSTNVSFTIDETGNVADITAVGADEKFNQLGVATVRKLKKWKPASVDGKPVKSKMSLPFKFNIQ